MHAYYILIYPSMYRYRDTEIYTLRPQQRLPLALLLIHLVMGIMTTTTTTTQPQHRNRRDARQNPQRNNHHLPPKPITHKPTPCGSQEHPQELRHGLDTECLRHGSLGPKYTRRGALHFIQHDLCLHEEGWDAAVEEEADEGEEDDEEGFVRGCVVGDEAEADQGDA